MSQFVKDGKKVNFADLEKRFNYTIANDIKLQINFCTKLGKDWSIQNIADTQGTITFAVVSDECAWIYYVSKKHKHQWEQHFLDVHTAEKVLYMMKRFHRKQHA